MKVRKLPEVEDREKQKSTRIHRASCACPTQHYGHRSRNGSDCRARRSMSFPRCVDEQINNACEQGERTGEDIGSERQIENTTDHKTHTRRHRRAARNVTCHKWPPCCSQHLSIEVAFEHLIPALQYLRQLNRHRREHAQASGRRNDPLPSKRHTPGRQNHQQVDAQLEESSIVRQNS